MMELGNQIVNRVYEARVDDSVRRASEMCDGPVREAWIRAKYVDRRFVLPIMKEVVVAKVENNEVAAANGDDEVVVAKTPKVARRWSVRRLRRRPNSKTKHGESEGGSDGCAEDNGLKVIDEDAKSDVSNGSVMVIGGDLYGTVPLKDEMALSSDQESNGEEDDSILGKFSECK